jgi:hypothetical protein
MLDFLPYLLLALVIAFVIAVGHKYHIDTKSTIEELTKDRNLYQKMAWQEIEAREKFLKTQKTVVLEHEYLIRELVEKVLDIRNFAQDLSETSNTEGKILLEKLDFLPRYEDMLSKKDDRPLRNGSPPGVERRF